MLYLLYLLKVQILEQILPPVQREGRPPRVPRAGDPPVTSERAKSAPA